jgi:hypothetical protein
MIGAAPRPFRLPPQASKKSDDMQTDELYRAWDCVPPYSELETDQPGRAASPAPAHPLPLPDFWLWLLRYRRRWRPVLMEAIASHAAESALHTLWNPAEVGPFIEGIEAMPLPRRCDHG